MAPDDKLSPPDAEPDFSNVQSGSSSTAPAAEPAPAPEPKTYTVVEGDSLWKIAQHHYGKGGEWEKIYEANKDRIKNPDLIHPGQVLVIPD